MDFKFSHENNKHANKKPDKEKPHYKDGGNHHKEGGGNQKEGHGIFGKGMNQKSSNRFAHSKLNDSDDDDEEENGFYDKKKKAVNNKSSS